jgi:NAD(P)H dehydrogenase (quinone)
MNVLLVLAHPERHSFNGAMFDAARSPLEAAGHRVVSSDLYRMGFDPVSSRRNFRSVKDADYLRLQAEEMWASEVGGFAHDVAFRHLQLVTQGLMRVSTRRACISRR